MKSHLDNGHIITEVPVERVSAGDDSGGDF